jgi:hypothetical protein
MANKFHITIDRSVIKLLGADLYGDVPSVINELVANSHDAKAHNVWIDFLTDKSAIVIRDDGIGMSVDDVNNYYWNVGYNRRDDKKLRKELGGSDASQDMGQKGIGKLSMFALSKDIDMVTYKDSVLVGCRMNFEDLCNKDKDPQEFDPKEDEAYFDLEKLVRGGKGTVLILKDVHKNIGLSFKSLVSHLLRAFYLNGGAMHIWLSKDGEGEHELKRSDLDFFSNMDTIVAIGDAFYGDIQKINDNKIYEDDRDFISKEQEKDLRFAKTYKEILEEPPLDERNPRKPVVIPKTIKINGKSGGFVDLVFNFSGWIGTVKNIDAFKKSASKTPFAAVSGDGDDAVTINDNRVSIFSRGKIGEYDILSKIKTRNVNDAYVIGEIFVDCFEDDRCVDMATSNRRGYQEDDPRYVELKESLEYLVFRVVKEKQLIANKINKLKDLHESKQIEDLFKKGQSASKTVFRSMKKADKEKISEDFHQFSRAVSERETSKKILISHRDDCKMFGYFLLKVLTDIIPSLDDKIIFTADKGKYGVPHGYKTIFDYLQECYRQELFTIFLFSKSFYDSNSCISEAGAAWATSNNSENVRMYSIIVVDFGFEDVEKPIDKDFPGVDFRECHDDIAKSLATEIHDNIFPRLDFEEANDGRHSYEEIYAAVCSEIKSSFPATVPEYVPSRKFIPTPTCPDCGFSTSISFDDAKKKLCYTCDKDRTHCKTEAFLKK